MLILLFACSRSFAQQDTILLFHPTVSTIKTYHFLINEVLDPELSRDLHFQGIYHTDEQYDYTLSEDYIASLPDEAKDHFSLSGISGNPGIDQIYSRNVFHPQFDALLEHSRGAIFNGGPDIPPSLYNEPMHLLTRVSDPWRHYMEVSALSMLLGTSNNDSLIPYLDQDPDFLILGICLGMQTMNVATGGSLVQDIPVEIYGFQSREAILMHPELMHRNYHFDDPTDSISLTGYHFHPISINSETRFYNLFIRDHETPEVLSSHHQAIQKLGKGLQVAATSQDNKIIEAIDHEVYPSVFGVQFHPEKSDLFRADHGIHVSADSLINFNEHAITHSSDGFHKRFWNQIFGLL